MMRQLISWDDLPEIISAQEAADVMRVNRALIYQLAKKNAFPHVRLGKHIRIPRDLFRKWVENNGQSERLV